LSARERRLLDPALLPVSLWEPKSQTLLLPPILAKAYETVIDRHNLRALAESRDPDNPPIGGLDKESADKHFAQAFDGSVARAQLAITDPKNEVMRASNAFIQTLSGNRVCITDAPCGAGAATLAFLSVIAELRACEVLPRQPLDVHLIGAEISNPARNYAVEILEELRSFFEQQAIFVKEEFLTWDVTNKMSNTDLIRRMTLASSEIKRRLLIVANFSGFLEKDGKKKAAKIQIEELFRYASGVNSVAIWIEPQTNKVINNSGLFANIIKWSADLFSIFSRINTDGDSSEPFLLSESRFKSPLNPEKTHRVRLAVMRLDLARSS
jgi:hypothetical protein